MSSFNRVILLGNLTRDPEVKYTAKGTAIGRIGLAVSRKFKQGDEWMEETTFVDIELWGRTAEIAGEYLKKGSSAMIEGRLKLDQWDDKATGQKRSKLLVVGETLQLLGGKSERQGERQTAQPPKPQQRTKPDPDLDAPEDDIPF